MHKNSLHKCIQNYLAEGTGRLVLVTVVVVVAVDVTLGAVLAAGAGRADTVLVRVAVMLVRVADGALVFVTELTAGLVVGLGADVNGFLTVSFLISPFVKGFLSVFVIAAAGLGAGFEAALMGFVVGLVGDVTGVFGFGAALEIGAPLDLVVAGVAVAVFFTVVVELGLGAVGFAAGDAVGLDATVVFLAAGVGAADLLLVTDGFLATAVAATATAAVVAATAATAVISAAVIPSSTGSEVACGISFKSSGDITLGDIGHSEIISGTFSLISSLTISSDNF